MAKWQINPAEYLKRVDLDIIKLLGLPELEEVSRIVPMRDIRRIISLVPIQFEVLTHLVKKIKTLDGRYPFLNSEVKLIKTDPNHLKVGQKYIFREKYQNLMEEMPSIFDPFAITSGGLANVGAYFVFGLNGGNGLSMACYLPPIIELHGDKFLVMDGIHRNFIFKQADSCPLSIHISNIDLPFPCSPHNWSETKIICLSAKPEKIEDRYFDLQPELFRDLKYLGIDG